MDKIHHIDHNWLTINEITKIVEENYKLELSDTAIESIEKCRNYLDDKIKQHKEPIYGINTGFGSLCNTSIPDTDLEKLQENLVKSHACGIGDEVPQHIVKLMLLLKIQGLSQGKSGVRVETVNRLIAFYNNNIFPVVYQQGSLGASGDLAPLANLSLPLIGLGEVYYENKKISTKELYNQLNWEPLQVQSKEGLALLNGTQFMSAYGVDALITVNKLAKWSDLIGAVSLDAYDGRIEPFDDLIHKVRPHNGQFITARNIKSCLEGSEIINQPKKHVQDPYSFRCMPQVHGACKDTIDYVTKIFETEINAVTDNPTIFPDEDKIISAGNFHGQPLAMGLDFLAVAIAELGSISERRTYKLIGGERGLPPFLVANPGLNSGFMIPQYAQASVVSQNKQLATPCSVDTIDSSNGQEDHVSMGANAATRVKRMLDNLEKILAIELLNAFQALEFKRPLKSSNVIEKLMLKYREIVPFVEDDVEMYVLIENSRKFISQNNPLLCNKNLI
ncbi:MAG: histidine ammonia-lyase [Vicingaceae bacterium]